jgi:hypothetical protein
MRAFRRIYANGVIHEFQKDLDVLIGRGNDVKKWITDNHPDRSNHPDYQTVDALRQRIERMKKYAASMDVLSESPSSTIATRAPVSPAVVTTAESLD